MRRIIYNFYWFMSSQLGLDILKLIKSVRRSYFFFRDLIIFKKKYKGPYSIKPCLHDRFDESGATRNEYFWQDLFVAQEIFVKNPGTHIDIGSRIDGFIGHIATFMSIEVFDIRPLQFNIPNVKFSQIDIMNTKEILKIKGKYNSISCLHTLEHFGLGRYGDIIDLDGYKVGFNNIASLLQESGILYLSTPIGRERIEFNANRIFHPKTIIDLAKSNSLEVEAMRVISKGYKIKNIPIETINKELEILSKEGYNLGIFILKKK